MHQYFVTLRSAAGIHSARIVSAPGFGPAALAAMRDAGTAYDTALVSVLDAATARGPGSAVGVARFDGRSLLEALYADALDRLPTGKSIDPDAPARPFVTENDFVMDVCEDALGTLRRGAPGVTADPGIDRAAAVVQYCLDRRANDAIKRPVGASPAIGAPFGSDPYALARKASK